MGQSERREREKSDISRERAKALYINPKDIIILNPKSIKYNVGPKAARKDKN
jgi:hypothetical protein